jgi:hypothetical protein
MSWGSALVGHVLSGAHKEAAQLLSQLPAQGGIREGAIHLSQALAKVNKQLGIGGSSAGAATLPAGVAGSPATWSSLQAGPARPFGTCGIPDRYRKAMTSMQRRPYQFMMVQTALGGTSFAQGPLNGTSTAYDFVQPVGFPNASSGAASIDVASQFPNYFVSHSARLTLTLGGGNNVASASGLKESQARLDAVEIVEFHAGQERARYPLADLHPSVERYVSDATGTAIHRFNLQGPGVMFEQFWPPQVNFDIYLNNEGPAFTPVNDMVFMLALKGSIGVDCYE